MLLLFTNKEVCVERKTTAWVVGPNATTKKKPQHLLFKIP